MSRTRTATGLFVALRVFFGVGGSGARSVHATSVVCPRRAVAVLGSFAMVLGVLALAAGPAVAFAPEAPETLTSTGVSAAAATLNGVLYPSSEPEVGSTYEFLYVASSKATKAECESGGALRAPASPGLVLEKAQPVSEQVSGLAQDTEYVVCLAATNAEAIPVRTVGPAVAFKTALPPEQPETSAATSVTASSATLNGVVNPKAKADTAVEYDFTYRVASTECEPGGTVEPVEPVKVVGKPKEPVSVEVSGLQPNVTYAFCVFARNSAEAGETAVGTPLTVKTLAAPATIDRESVSNVKSTEATLEGAVNPNNQFTECHFQYGTLAVSENEVPCSPELLKDTFGEQTVSPTTVNEKGETVPAPISVSPGSTYKYRVLTKNAKGEEEAGKEEAFNTFEAPTDEKATALTATTATLHGVLNPSHAGEPGTYEFVYKRSATECQLSEAERGQLKQEEEEVQKGKKQQVAIVQRRAPEPAGAAAGSQAEAVSGEATGLHPGATYTFCLLARNASGEEAAPLGVPEQLTAVAAVPAIESAGSSHETASSAELEAVINPDGAETEYHFEYDTRAYAEGEAPHGTSVPVPVGVIPAGASGVSVPPQPIGPLSQNTTYHWRVVAENTAGKTASAEHTFVYDTLGAGSSNCPEEAARQARGSLNLPDCRAYEMATPPDKNGTLIGNPFLGGGVAQISEDGGRVIARAIGCFQGAQSCIPSREAEGTPFEFTRTPDGWVTHPLAPPAGEFERYSTWSLNANADTVLFSAPTPTGQEDFYARKPNGEITPVGPFEEQGLEHDGYRQLATAEGVIATADLSHVLYATGRSFWAFDHTEHEALYEYVGTGNAAPLMVGVKGGRDSHELVSTCATKRDTVSRGRARFIGPISADGRTVYFTAEGRNDGECASVTAPAADELWARVDGELPDAHSVLVSGPTPATCNEAQCEENAASTQDSAEGGQARDASFEGASVDGARAFFSSAQQLTNNAGQDEGENLYESACAEPCGKPGEEPDASERELVDVSETAAHEKVVGGPRVGGVEAISGDGSHVYFVAQGVLTGEQENQNHEKAKDGEENLYVYQRDEGHPEGQLAFIARLAPTDEVQNWRLRSGDIANVTPDGRFLVFTSHRALTVDDTRAEGPAQVYEYDAGTGVLVRVSIGQDGFNDNGNDGTGEASIVEAATQGVSANSVPVRSDPTMSDNGAFVFFRSPVALAPGALDDVVTGHENGKTFYAQNFYEYHAGRVFLISDGKDTTATGNVSENLQVSGAYSTVNLLGSDVSGANVFFSTFDRLTPEDTDTQLDYYDAHICSEGELCTVPVLEPSLCGEASCQGSSGAPQGYGAPASQTFSGQGNLTPTPSPPPPRVEAAAEKRAKKLAAALKVCRKKHAKHKRKVCELKARKAFGAKRASRSSSAKRASNDRGAGR